MSSVKGREILIGVTGGVAAYKTADLVSKLVQQGACVTVVMTPAAHQFIGETTFQALTNRPVYTQLFHPQEHHLGEHIGLPRRAELILVAPASADFLAKTAIGMADSLLSCLLLAATCPVLMAPAMNVEMWSKPATQRNLQQLKDDGYTIVEPDEGWLSCQVKGKGRMVEPVTLLEQIEKHLPGPVC